MGGYESVRLSSSISDLSGFDRFLANPCDLHADHHAWNLVRLVVLTLRSFSPLE